MAIIMVRVLGHPEGHETPLAVQSIRVAFQWPAVDRGHLVAGWTKAIEVTPYLRRHVLVVTADGRVAVTRFTSMVGFREAIGDPDFVHANQSVCVNLRHIDCLVRNEGLLVYYPRGTAHPEAREVINLSRLGQRAVWDRLDGPSKRRPPVRIRAHDSIVRPVPATRLLLVRHGEIEPDVENRWHGSDAELTAQGREEAWLVAEHLATRRPSVAAVYTSPLAQARATAAEIAAALGMPVVPVPALAEHSIGDFEDVTFDDVMNRHRFAEQTEADPGWAPPRGESLVAVATRVMDTWRDVARLHVGCEVVLVSHDVATATALATLLDADPRQWPKYRTRNASVSEIILEPEPTLVAFDVVEHLEPPRVAARRCDRR